VASDETWVHHYDPDNKRQCMEYHHKGSQAPKKFKAKDSAGKVMWTVFWNSEGVLYSHVPTVNQKPLLQLLSSWWWAWGWWSGRPDHDQQRCYHHIPRV